LTELEKTSKAALVPSEWDYAPAPESREIVRIDERYGHFVGGEWLAPRETYTTIAPASEEPLAEIGQATPEEVQGAIATARAAFENGWSALPGSERAKYLFRIARILQERSREFAVLESLNGGKPIRESRDVDLPLAAAHFFYYAGWADKLEYAFPNRRPRPIGVAGQIIPWNFPLLMLAWKIAPALAAGNTVVLKPAETTPLTALLFCDVVRQAELPAGVVNIVTGDGRAGAAIVEGDVDKIAFTGSTEVGKAIQREVAGSGKRLTLELGGKAANIVFDDCALDQAVEGIVNGIYFNQGHVCCAGSRLFVQESIHEDVVKKLKRRMKTLRVGDPLDKNTDVGAINSRAQLEKIQELVAAGEEEGAEIYQPPCQLPEKGYWFAPTVFTNVAQSYRIAQEEIFGPVLSVLTFRTPAEAVEKANNTPYGLSAGIWTEKGSRILWMAERMRAGVVWANTFNRFDPASPFGGYKESGFGGWAAATGSSRTWSSSREQCCALLTGIATHLSLPRDRHGTHFFLRSQWGGGRARLEQPTPIRPEGTMSQLGACRHVLEGGKTVAHCAAGLATLLLGVLAFAVLAVVLFFAVAAMIHGTAVAIAIGAAVVVLVAVLVGLYFWWRLG
jgi:aldehyde dehydrogenase (NAD+)